MDPMSQYNQQGGGVPPPPQGMGGMNGGMMSPSGETTNEELIEAIIDEKWNDLVKDFDRIIEWKNATENRITVLEQKMNDLSSSFDKLHQAVVGKVGEYDKHILDVGSEIKAMEKVFAKVLPLFTENVSELSRITDDIKDATGRSSSDSEHDDY